MSYNPLALCPFSAASVLLDAHDPKGARMEENTNLLESGTAPTSGMTDQEEANTAPKVGAAEADEVSTASGSGTTNREKSRTGGPTDTWTVRGVEIETRRAAKLAAKREGKFLGDWLNDTIRTAATATLKGNTLPARPEDVTNVLQRLLDERLQPITEQLKSLSDQRPPAPLPAPTFWQRLTGRA
jgi:hypothetical protein